MPTPTPPYKNKGLSLKEVQRVFSGEINDIFIERHYYENAGQRITIFHPVFDKSLKTDDRLNSIMIDLQIQSDIDAVSILDDYNSRSYWMTMVQDHIG